MIGRILEALDPGLNFICERLSDPRLNPRLVEVAVLAIPITAGVVFLAGVVAIVSWIW